MGLDLVLVANMLVLLKDKVVVVDVDVVVADVVGAAGDDANVVVGVGAVDDGDGDGHLWSDL